MSTTTEETTQQAEPEAVELQLMDIVKGAIKAEKVSDETAITIGDAFAPFAKQADEWLEKAKAIKVTDIEQKAEMKLARESRLAIRQIRINADKTRKALKDDAQQYVKAVDAAGRQIREKLEPIEEILSEQEKFAERYEAEQKANLAKERGQQLEALGANAQFYNLADISQEDFDTVLQQAKDAHTAKLEREKREAEERAAREKADAEERERIRKENERLKAEAVEREKKEAEERTKREAEEKARREAVEKAEAERKAKHRKVLSRQIEMKAVEGLTDYDTLAEMSDVSFDSALADAKAKYDELQKARQLKADQERKEREELDRKIAEERAAREKAEADAKAKAEEEAKRMGMALDSAAKHAAEIVIETAYTWADNHPRTVDGRNRFLSAVIGALSDARAREGDAS